MTYALADRLRVIIEALGEATTPAGLAEQLKVLRLAKSPSATQEKILKDMRALAAHEARQGLSTGARSGSKQVSTVTAGTLSHWLNGKHTPNNWSQYRHLLLVLLAHAGAAGPKGDPAARDLAAAVVEAFRQALARLHHAESDRKRHSALFTRAPQTAAAQTAAAEAVPELAPPPGGGERTARTRQPLSFSRRHKTAVLGALLVLAGAGIAAFLALGDDPYESAPEAGPSPRTTAEAAARDSNTPHPSAASSRLEWSHDDGTHRAIVDNAPRTGGGNRTSWITIDDRKPDRHWAGIVFILKGERLTENPKDWKHRHIDYSGANNGDVEHDGHLGVFPAKKVYAARICEGMASELDPATCGPWQYVSWK
ncbi:hypothetical protein ACWGFX_06655 [Streptomyces xanthophaeus]